MNNPKVKCKNCIYSNKNIPIWEGTHNHATFEATQCSYGHNAIIKNVNDFCGYFTDKDTGKTYKDLYFEEKEPKCNGCEDVIQDPTDEDLIYEYEELKANCPIHNK